MYHQSRVAVFVHLTWGTWDRLPLLTSEIELAVHRALGAECARFGVDLVAIGGVEDHVHLLIRLPATVALAELMKQLKGSSTHLVTHQLARGQFFKWQGGYFAFSVSPRHLRRVSDYIAEQRQHHLSNNLLPCSNQKPKPLQPHRSSPHRGTLWRSLQPGFQSIGIPTINT